MTTQKLNGKIYHEKQSEGMNKMVVEDKRIEKMCSFYVSDFHLEMILVPFINKKIEEKENVIIKTENNLKDSVEILLSKMNLKEENKEKILKLNWNTIENKSIEDKSNVIIIGNKKYIEEVNNQIKQKSIKDITVIDCYNVEDIKDDMDNIINKYSQNLNTMGLEKY